MIDLLGTFIYFEAFCYAQHYGCDERDATCFARWLRARHADAGMPYAMGKEFEIWCARRGQ